MSYIIHITTGGKDVKEPLYSLKKSCTKEIKDISKEENRSVAEVIREAMGNYINQKKAEKEKDYPLSA